LPKHATLPTKHAQKQQLVTVGAHVLSKPSRATQSAGDVSVLVDSRVSNVRRMIIRCEIPPSFNLPNEICADGNIDHS
jgi:hypothetical protein